MKIVLASSNQGKINEIKQLLQSTQIDVISQGALDINDVDETGQTFVENALLKARYAALKSGLPAIADDSGLVVPALQGEPGIYSARYAGQNTTAEKNIKKLLSNLAAANTADRSAYFYCVIVYLRHQRDPCPIICEGKWSGKILSTPRGQGGFGYDPVFFDEHYQCSAAELPAEIKNTVSHRGQAMNQFVRRFRK